MGECEINFGDIYSTLNGWRTLVTVALAPGDKSWLLLDGRGAVLQSTNPFKHSYLDTRVSRRRRTKGPTGNTYLHKREYSPVSAIMTSGLFTAFPGY